MAGGGSARCHTVPQEGSSAVHSILMHAVQLRQVMRVPYPTASISQLQRLLGPQLQVGAYTVADFVATTLLRVHMQYPTCLMLVADVVHNAD